VEDSKEASRMTRRMTEKQMKKRSEEMKVEGCATMKRIQNTTSM
jgi:hypothetical protein